MVVINNPYLDIPEDTLEIWRYMDFTKFVSMLDNKALYFSRSDYVGDSFEGAVSKKKLDELELWDAVIDFAGQEAVQREIHTAKKNIPFHYLNCWHINDGESAAMWRLYAQTNEAIAVKSTIKRFRLSLSNVRQKIHLGQIKYDFDDSTESSTEENPVLLYFHKRKSFRHEQEVRGVISNSPNEKDYDKSLIGEVGFYVPTDIDTLIEEIYVAPSSGAWFKDLVKSMTKKYGYKKNITNSRLEQKPYD